MELTQYFANFYELYNYCSSKAQKMLNAFKTEDDKAEVFDYLRWLFRNRDFTMQDINKYILGELTIKPRE